MDPKGHAAIVTGAASGLGAETAVHLARAGVKVACLDINIDGARETAEKIGGVAIRCDVTSSDNAEAALKEARGRNRGGTDSTSFNWAGLAGIGGGQDTIEYGSHTHHTNLDSYERIVVEDVKKNAVITASLMYHLAMRDELLPRFKTSDFPPPNAPAGRGRSGQ